MVFYVSLFIVSMAVAALAVWLFRSLVHVRHNVYRAFLPSARESNLAGGMARAHRRRPVSGELRVPWGWGKRPTSKLAAEEYAIAPRGGSPRRQVVGWPYREEPFEFPGQRRLGDAKPGEKVVRTRKVSKGGVEKPWGW